MVKDKILLDKELDKLQDQEVKVIEDRWIKPRKKEKDRFRN